MLLLLAGGHGRSQTWVAFATRAAGRAPGRTSRFCPSLIATAALSALKMELDGSSSPLAFVRPSVGPGSRSNIGIYLQASLGRRDGGSGNVQLT